MPTNASAKTRSPEQKQRRKLLWISREADRCAANEKRFRARYDELKIEMARHGQIIGPIADLDRYDDPVRRFEVLKARVERWEALWSITLRKRETRGKIMIGGAILAELADLDPADPADASLFARLVDLLDRRVLRVRDRQMIRQMLDGAARDSTPLPLRPGGPLDEDMKTALKVIGEGFTFFEDPAVVRFPGVEPPPAEDGETFADTLDGEDFEGDQGDAAAV